MQNKYFFSILLLFIGTISANAQNVLKGTVYENASNIKLTNVFIRDNNTKQLTITDNNGNFSIKTETGHLLIFDSPGYVSDSLYVADLAPKKIQLVIKTIALRQVSVSASKQAFDPHKEYPDVYNKSKVYALSPSSWFSKEGKDARRMKKYFEIQAQEDEIDKAFSMSYVSSIVPLKGQDLEDFVTLYRPSYAFVKSNNSESMAVYINDSYKKFKILPPEKRHQQRLVTPLQ
jgi:hypothetical protein